MCDFCERGILLRSCNFYGGAKLIIHQEGFESDIGMLELYGEEHRFPLFKTIYRPRFDINFCPMCGQRLGKDNIK